MILLSVRALALACRGHHELVLENIALRQQLRAIKRTTKRPRLRAHDRLFWIGLASVWRRWRTALMIVQPATVMRWHHDWLRRRWTRCSTKTRCGRTPIDGEIRTLVGKMASANPLWGAPRIHGELTKLGVDVSERTVSRLLRTRHHPPSQTWRTFLTNHLAAVSVDFFTVPTVTGRVLFVLVVLSHHRRRIVHFNITEHPTAAWAAQQVVEAFPNDTTPQWLLRDRDSIYGDAFRRRVAGMGITEVICSPASPWQNPYAERVIGSIRRECLNHVVVFGAAHLRRLLSAYVAYYHGSRTHLGLEAKTRLTADRSNRQAPDRSSRFPKSVVSITDTSVARRKPHVLLSDCRIRAILREYSRLALARDGLPRSREHRVNRACTATPVRTAFNPLVYDHGSAR